MGSRASHLAALVDSPRIRFADCHVATCAPGAAHARLALGGAILANDSCSGISAGPHPAVCAPRQHQGLEVSGPSTGRADGKTHFPGGTEDGTARTALAQVTASPES